jgi:hypothetical protein
MNARSAELNVVAPDAASALTTVLAQMPKVVRPRPRNTLNGGQKAP